MKKIWTSASFLSSWFREIEEGHSAPISFEPIAHRINRLIQGTVIGQAVVQVTLETAVDFVTSLEKREVEAFGHQPDPIISTQNLGDGSRTWLG